MKSTSLIGKAKELQVASRLVDVGFYVYFPLVDNGFDLVVSNSNGSKFVPVQVKYRKVRSGFALDKQDVEKFKAANPVVIFGSDNENGATDFWYFPFEEWHRKMEDREREDGKLVVYLKEDQNEIWANHYLNDKGIGRAFAELISNEASS